MRRKWTFSKLLLLLESAVVLYTTYEGFALARLAVGYGYLGTLPWGGGDGERRLGGLRRVGGLLLQQGKGGEHHGRHRV